MGIWGNFKNISKPTMVLPKFEAVFCSVGASILGIVPIGDESRLAVDDVRAMLYDGTVFSTHLGG